MHLLSSIFISTSVIFTSEVPIRLADAGDGILNHLANNEQNIDALDTNTIDT